jgi:2-polyprenyl-3-methyl-5-hydroxy-6-metoxy-1,4-benzoquinol methylase
MTVNFKSHWENVYQLKNENEVSWYQEVPSKSLDLINSLNLTTESKIIDVGAGESRLVDNLLRLGFKNITVLDISSKSIEKTKQRLGKKSKLVKWIVSDIVDFIPDESFDLWHDRAAFHFLTQKTWINKYVDLVNNSVNSKGNLILSTFSTNGPLKCSGLQISQYNKNSISELFKEEFKLSYSETSVHQTPFNTNQEFIFNIFSKY